MTLRLTIGIDPGITGAICVLADGVINDVFDMPVEDVRTKQRVGGKILGAMVSGLFMTYRGADIHVITEIPFARPGESPMGGQRSGINYGILLGVLQGRGVRFTEITPQRWKKHFNLIGRDKNESRVLCLRNWGEQVGMYLDKKKHHGRADAILIARYGYETEIWAE